MTSTVVMVVAVLVVAVPRLRRAAGDARRQPVSEPVPATAE